MRKTLSVKSIRSSFFTTNNTATNHAISSVVVLNKSFHTFLPLNFVEIPKTANKRVTPTSMKTVVYERPEETVKKIEKRFLRKSQMALDKRNPTTIEKRVETILQDLKIHGVKPTIQIYTTLINAMVKSLKPDKSHEIYENMLSDYSLKDIPYSILIYMINSCKYKNEDVRATDYFKQFKQKIELDENNISNKDILIRLAYTSYINNMGNVGERDKCESAFNEYKQLYGEDSIDFKMYGALMKCYSFLGDYDQCVNILNLVKDKAFSILPSLDLNKKKNEEEVADLTPFFNMLITSCQTLEQVELVRKQMDDEQVTFNQLSYVNMLNKYLQFDAFDRMFDLYENHLKLTPTIRAPQSVFYLLLEACYREGFHVAESVKQESKQEINRKVIFNMHRINKYWKEMRNLYNHKEPNVELVEALRKIVNENKEDKREYRLQVKQLFKSQKNEKLSKLKSVLHESTTKGKH
ncbi:hypothetical protein ABK040_015625 [Willaertia magna]